MKIKRILVSQPKPETAKSPYFDLAEKNNVQVDFRPFIQVEGVSAKEFRQTRVQILDHGAVIFTSRTAIDHFFRISTELRLTIPDTMPLLMQRGARSGLALTPLNYIWHTDICCISSYLLSPISARTNLGAR